MTIVTRRSAAFVTCCVGVLLLVTAACSPRAVEPSDGRRTEELAALLEAVSRSGSGFQREILADGKVSRSEYERAFDAAVSCMRQQGLEVAGPHPVMGDRYLLYTVRDAPGSDSIQATCDDEYLDFVRQVWTYQQTPTGEEADRIRVEYVRCLQAQGLDVPDDATLDEIDGVALDHPGSGVDACVERYSTRIFISREPEP